MQLLMEKKSINDRLLLLRRLLKKQKRRHRGTKYAIKTAAKLSFCGDAEKVETRKLFLAKHGVSNEHIAAALDRVTNKPTSGGSAANTSDCTMEEESPTPPRLPVQNERFILEHRLTTWVDEQNFVKGIAPASNNVWSERHKIDSAGVEK